MFSSVCLVGRLGLALTDNSKVSDLSQTCHTLSRPSEAVDSNKPKTTSTKKSLSISTVTSNCHRPVTPCPAHLRPPTTTTGLTTTSTSNHKKQQHQHKLVRDLSNLVPPIRCRRHKKITKTSTSISTATPHQYPNKHQKRQHQHQLITDLAHLVVPQYTVLSQMTDIQ